MEDKIIVYRTYYNPIEANIVKGRLEDSDIPCFLTDENIATIQPLYNQAIGGVKLNVFEKDVNRINQLLAEEQIDIEVDNEAPISDKLICNNCGSDNVSFSQATKKKLVGYAVVCCIICVSF